MTMASSTREDEVLLTEVLLGGQMWSRRLRRGQRLRLTDLQGGAALTALFYNAQFLTERYNMPDTLKAQQIARISRGNALYSDMGRVLCSVVADTVGWHDTITGFGNAALTARQFGKGSYQELRNGFYRNTRDNLLIELAKYGLGKADLSGNVNFFVKVAVDEVGDLSFVTPHSKAMDYVELRADLDILMVLSNTPHPLDPARAYAPKPVRLQLLSGSPAAANDFVRLACPENQRGFTLNDQYCL